MKTLFSYLLITSLLLVQSCGLGEWEITGISILRIEGSSKIVCKYDAWGGLDSHAFGYRLMDSTETFNINVIEDLPFYDLISIPTKERIIGISHKCDKSCGEYYEQATPTYNPIENEKTVNQNILIQHLTYQYKGYSKRSKGYSKYEFEYFKETRDSLFFYNLNDVTSKNGKNLDSLDIKKKMVEIQTPKNSDKVSIIIIESIDIDNESNELKGHKTYHLIPKNIITLNQFSDYGIFKSI